MDAFSCLSVLLSSVLGWRSPRSSGACAAAMVAAYFALLFSKLAR